MSDKLPRDGKVTITLRIPPEVRRWLKVYCAQQELFMDQVVLSLLATLPGCPVDAPVVDSQTATPSGQPASQPLRDPELSTVRQEGGLPAQRVESIAGNELSAPLQQLATEQLREVTKAFQERLQTSEAHTALERAFNSTPEELGSMLPRNDALDVDELASLLDH